MTAHDHRTVVDGCFRCELGQDEVKWVAEAIAEAFHAKYEELAPAFHYKTREASAVPWKYLPSDNRALMVATVEALMDAEIIEAGAEV